jgi:hypothetical protein
VTVAPTGETDTRSIDAHGAWLRRPAASDRFFAGDQRVSTAGGSADEARTSPAFQALTAPAITSLAAQLAVPLFVGRPDPALRPPTISSAFVNGS